MPDPRHGAAPAPAAPNPAAIPPPSAAPREREMPRPGPPPHLCSAAHRRAPQLAPPAGFSAPRRSAPRTWRPGRSGAGAAGPLLSPSAPPRERPPAPRPPRLELRGARLPPHAGPGRPRPTPAPSHWATGRAGGHAVLRLAERAVTPYGPSLPAVPPFGGRRPVCGSATLR